jgi:hypothetical protein
VVRKDEVPSRKAVNPSGDKFATSYPNITTFINDDQGWIEIGRDEYSRSFIRAVNMGGLVWEGETHYATMDEALQALEAGVATWWED